MSGRAHLIYCHGFASGPETTSKGRALREHLGSRLASMTIPALDGGDFRAMTCDSMARVLLAAVARLPDDGAPVLLAGSSLGGWLVAWQCAVGALRPSGLLLISPAFGFTDRWQTLLGDAGIAEWRRRGCRTFWHYALESEQELGVAFLDSCEGIDAEPAPVAIPTTVIHGRRDETVDWHRALSYVQRGAGVEFHLLDEGHAVDSPAATALLLDRAAALIDRVSA